MSSPVVGEADGMPLNLPFDQTHGGDAAAFTAPLGARLRFLHGCGLVADGSATTPSLWSGAEQWHVLELGFDQGLNFLATWHAWRIDPHRPLRLFYSAVEAHPIGIEDLARVAAAFPDWGPLVQELSHQWHGLLPGTHRLAFENGNIQLTLGVGHAHDWLSTLDVAVNSVFLDGYGPATSPDGRDTHTLKAVTRLCRPGTRLTSGCTSQAQRDGLTALGFNVDNSTSAKPPDGLDATFAPRWPIKTVLRQAIEGERRVIVVGAGLAGSAVAYSLARRGWQVDVLDRADTPASGASGLPSGIVAPHVSPDDSGLSRLSRAGVRMTLLRAAACLQAGTDWSLSGVLEHRVEGKRGLPDAPAWREPGQPGWFWSHEATAEQRAGAQLPPDAPALWHAHAGWLRPAALVRAQLQHPNIEWHGAAEVAQLQRHGSQWQLTDASGALLAQAPRVVLATAYPTAALLHHLWPHLPLNALRGQITWDWLDRLPPQLQEELPPFPVNGYGNWVIGRADRNGRTEPCWILGSTFERGATDPTTKPQDQVANSERLQRLLPSLAPGLQSHWPAAQAWAAVRCTLPDRLPAVGPVNEEQLPGLMLCTGMGARGLTLSVLCGEWIGAYLHGEPWPMERKLAQALAASRFGALARRR